MRVRFRYMKEIPLVLTFNFRRVCLTADAANTRPSAFVLVCVSNAGFAVRRASGPLSLNRCRNHGGLDAALSIDTNQDILLVSDGAALILTKSTLALSLLTTPPSVLVE